MDPRVRADTSARPGPDHPLNMALNEGTYAPEACRAVFAKFAQREACRRYSSSDNAPLLERIGELHGVTPESVFLGHGSGPLLKEGIVTLIRSAIMNSPTRIIRHVLKMRGFPVITPVPSYSKVAAGAIRNKLGLIALPLRPENSWALDLDALRRVLKRRSGLVYLCNPNNPTGTPMIRRFELVDLLERFPRSVFWVDEAYIHYLEPRNEQVVADLTSRFKNLVVSRSFSFAYGLAAIRLGYMISNPGFIEQIASKHVPYRLGLFQEELALAALNDAGHLPFVRRETARARAQLTEALTGHPTIELFPSEAHFMLCRFRDGRPARPFVARMRQRGVDLRVFDPVLEHSFDNYFRITLGTEPENQYLIDSIHHVLPVIQA
ncbi:MAG: histidinol-phosphate transaminase [Myxococcota bacterium]